MDNHVVSIHAPVWVRLPEWAIYPLEYGVSIHAPVWVRQLLVRYLTINEGFQFTHPCGCDCMATVGQLAGPCFNSRTRVGATSLNPPQLPYLLVSIHAPVWVRRLHIPPLSIPPEFQFTHPCGCDKLSRPYILRTCSFNSRTRVGATLGRNGAYFHQYVSIHAPVWVRRIVEEKATV